MVHGPGAAGKSRLPVAPCGTLVLMLKVAVTPVDGPFGLAAKLKIPVPPRLFLVMVSAARLASTKVQSAGRPGATITVTVGLTPGVPGPHSALTKTKPLTEALGSEEHKAQLPAP